MHLRATFCTDEWLREHAYMQINEVVVMYLDTAQIERPRVPPSVSPVEGIQSTYSFFMLGDGLLCARAWPCWCYACSRVRSRADLKERGTQDLRLGGVLEVDGCTRKHLTVWRHKPRITSTAAKGTL